MVYDSDLWLGSYDPGVGAEVEITDHSVVERFEEIRKEYGDRPAAHFFGVTLTFEQVMSCADQLARCLADHGLGKGDVLGVSLPNTPQYLIALVGGLKAGCAVSGVSPLLTPGEMAYQLKDCGAKALVIMDILHEKRLAQIADGLPDLKLVIPTMILDFLPRFKQLLAKWLKKVPAGKAIPLPGKKVLPFMEVLAQYPARHSDPGLTHQDACFIQYTGGTTGTPKGAVLTHRNMLSTITQFGEWFKVSRGEDVVLSAYPMFHIAGIFTAFNALAFGCSQVLIPNPRETKHIVEELGKYRPQWIANVPSLYMMLLKEPGFRRLDFSRLRVCISAAAPMPVEGLKELESVVGSGKVVEIYGMTETSPLTCMMPYQGVHKFGSVGVAPPSTRVKIMDLETGDNEVPLGEEGEVIVRGPQVMKEYHNKPNETALAIREHDGELWMHSGDVGRMDGDGYVTLVDRAKDMVCVSGYKVFPRELEDKLYEHPAVDLCAVIGVPNPERPETEMVKLVVQKSAEYDGKPDDDVKHELMEYSRSNLAPFKIPRIIEFREVPLTAAGKVDKKALR